MKLPNIIIRAIAGAVFVALLIGGVLYEYTFAIIFSIVIALALHEFYNLVEKSMKITLSKYLNIAAGVLLFAGSFLLFSGQTALGLLSYLVVMMAIFVRELYMKREDPIKSLAYSVLGQVYIAVPFSLANYLAYTYTPLNGEPEYHFAFILGVLVFIWVNDTFAYLTGMTFGKHRLFERISPKKSWEGFVGGAIAAIASSLLFYHFFGQLSIPVWMGLAAVVVVFGTWGDLIESLMKRTFGVKDSSGFIPGHGGILDRLDSTIFAIPAAVVYLATMFAIG